MGRRPKGFVVTRTASPPSGRPFSAVIFDYGHVLSHPPRAPALRRIEQVFGLRVEDLPGIYAQSRPPYDKGELSPREYWERFALAAGISISPELIEKLRRWDIELWSDVDQRMVDWVQALRATGIKTALLSNMPHDMIDHVRENFAWLSYFDVQVLSAELGIVKPDPPIYQECLDRLGATAREALFLDDREANVRGGESVGLVGLQVRSFSELRRDLAKLGVTPLPRSSARRARSEH
jgi:putative hydrolase of the HAD superfamily